MDLMEKQDLSNSLTRPDPSCSPFVFFDSPIGFCENYNIRRKQW